MFASQKVEAIVVEDDAHINEALCGCLKGIGITNVQSAKNGLQALRLIKEHPDVDFIVLDVFMPEMDGVEVLKALTDLNFTGGIILNSGEEEILQSSAKLGNAYRLDVWAAFLKPFSLDELAHVLRKNITPSSL